MEKCSLAEYPFALDPDTPPEAGRKSRPTRIFYKGVECDACREVIPAREFLGNTSGFDADGSPHRICTTCEINESAFNSTDESG